VLPQHIYIFYLCIPKPKYGATDQPQNLTLPLSANCSQQVSTAPRMGKAGEDRVVEHFENSKDKADENVEQRRQEEARKTRF